MSQLHHLAGQAHDGLCLHELIELQAAKGGHLDAVAYEGLVLTLAEVNSRANRLAHYLRAAGVVPDKPVAVCLDRSPEMIIALLAVLKAGGAYVPIDPAYPKDRIAYIIRDAGPILVLTSDIGDANLRRAISSLPKPMPVLCLVRDAEQWAAQSDANLPASQMGLTPRHLCYIMYTSGSTGTPKGVMLEHRGVVNRLLWGQRAFPIGNGDRFLQKTPFCFDVSVPEIFWPLMTGAKIILCRPSGHRDPAYLARILASEGVTLVHFVPSMLQTFMAANPDISLPSLRYIFCSGEALGKAIAAVTHKAFHQSELINLYGPTEASIEVTYWRYDAGSSETYSSLPIGTSIDNVQVDIIDEAGNLVPEGQAGEIQIRGLAVARGYINKPEQTAARFKRDPSSYDISFKTGDLGRRLGDGNIEFLGRSDAQIKLRGFRIELGEIEAVLGKHPWIASAVVAPKTNEKGDTHLVAYYTRRTATPVPLPPDGLARHLAAALPDYMVPAAYVALSGLPMTESGKLDYKSLPLPSRDSFLVQPFVAPISLTEKRLSAIWSDALHLHPIGRHDNFFNLGGDSLLAMDIIIATQALLASELKLELELADIFENPTLSQYASHLDTLSEVTPG